MSKKKKAPRIVEDKELEQAGGAATYPGFMGGVYVATGDIDDSPTLKLKTDETSTRS